MMPHTEPIGKPFGRPVANVVAQCQRCGFTEGYDPQDSLLLVWLDGKAYVRQAPKSDERALPLKEIHNPKFCGGKFKYFHDRIERYG